MTRTLLPGTVLALLALTGCGLLDKPRNAWDEREEQVSGVDKHSSYPAVRRVYFEQLNLVELIDPRDEAKTLYPAAWESMRKLKRDGDERGWGIHYDLAFSAFRESARDPNLKRLHRNSVQDRILSVADSRCNVFKTYLRRQQSNWNFWLGSATTAAGVLGAVLTGVNSSRNLAGAAGLFSGIQAEYNQQYFSNLASHVIVQGIEVRQAKMLATVVKERQTLGIDDYSIEAAVKDAITYDGSCSALAGLGEASESIKESVNPGLPRAFEIIASVRALNELAHAEDMAQLADTGRLQKLQKQATPLTSPLVAAIAKPQAGAAFWDKAGNAAKAPTRVKELVADRASQLAAIHREAQGRLPEAQRSATPTDADIRAAFQKMVETELVAKLPLAKCVAALTTPAKKAAEAEVTVKLSQEGSPDRLNAIEQLDIARSSTGLAAGRVELLVDAVGSSASRLARAWEGELRNGTALAAMPKPTVPDGLSTLCP